MQPYKRIFQVCVQEFMKPFQPVEQGVAVEVQDSGCIRYAAFMTQINI